MTITGTLTKPMPSVVDHLFMLVDHNTNDLILQEYRVWLVGICHEAGASWMVAAIKQIAQPNQDQLQKLEAFVEKTPMARYRGESLLCCCRTVSSGTAPTRPISNTTLPALEAGRQLLVAQEDGEQDRPRVRIRVPHGCLLVSVPGCALVPVGAAKVYVGLLSETGV